MLSQLISSFKFEWVAKTMTCVRHHSVFVIWRRVDVDVSHIFLCYFFRNKSRFIAYIFIVLTLQKHQIIKKHRQLPFNGTVQIYRAWFLIGAIQVKGKETIQIRSKQTCQTFSMSMFFAGLRNSPAIDIENCNHSEKREVV